MAGVRGGKGVWADWKIILVALVTLLIGSNGYWVRKEREEMRVTRVIDGDTFVIKAGERVRLIGLDAPEAGGCLGEEAKNKLAELVENKIVKIDRGVRYSFGRRLGVVYSGDINVNLEVVRSGLARYDSFSDEKSPELELAGRAAEETGLGIYSGACDKNTTCVILGNIDESSGKKYYHVPGCPTYSRVRIDTERGEKKFCSEGEAKAQGFVLAPDCA